MSAPATAADVQKRWRPLTEQETQNADTFIRDAWRAVRRGVPDIVARLEIATDEDLNDDVVAVLANAALRVLKNIDGAKREGADDYTWEANEAAASGLLYVSAAELDSLRPLPIGYVGPAYVIGLGG